jgi:hypothetical protein
LQLTTRAAPWQFPIRHINYCPLCCRLGPGTLYEPLARLERLGSISALPPEERRLPYRLSQAGWQKRARFRACKLAATRLRRLAAAAGSVAAPAHRWSGQAAARLPRERNVAEPHPENEIFMS